MTTQELSDEMKKIARRAAIDSAGTDTLSELKAIGARYNAEMAAVKKRFLTER